MCEVDEVYIVFKTHLDVGFSDTARNVIALYVRHYFPAAIELARSMRHTGEGERFIWTTGSWLIHEYLEQAAPAERARLEEAIAAGDIAWHGLPFTTHSELLDPSLFTYGLRLSQDLDARFGKKTIAAKMTDVPGHTRGIVPLLAAAGIHLLHIGVNPASTPPDVPPVFVWRDATGVEVITVYSKGAYGGLTVVPEARAALLVAHTDDNAGVQSAAEVRAIFQRMRTRFPQARVHASTLDAFARRLLGIKAALPVVTAEIGDTWIHGAGSDPQKVAQFRELCRRRRSWLAAGRVSPDDRAFRAFSRALLLVAEHTWGLDSKLHLADYTHYGATQFRAARGQENFKRMEASWDEQRAYVREAVAALGESAAGREAATALRDLQPRVPDLAGYGPIAAGADRIETAHFVVGIDPHHGSLCWLQQRENARRWATPGHPLALVSYQTFSQADYDRFWARYVVNKRAVAAWARPDQTKPGLASAAPEHRTWLPQVVAAWQRRDDSHHRVVVELCLPAECRTLYGGPEKLMLEYAFPHAEPAVYVTLQWFGKPACRLPEALWLSFAPRVRSAQGWRLEKMGQGISPREVVRNGNRRLHAVDGEVSYSDAQGRLTIETLDAPLVAPGKPSLLDFDNRQPHLRNGMHVNLYNNVWGTNFPLWYEDDARFRFIIRVCS